MTNCLQLAAQHGHKSSGNSRLRKCPFEIVNPFVRFENSFATNENSRARHSLGRLSREGRGEQQCFSTELRRVEESHLSRNTRQMTGSRARAVQVSSTIRSSIESQINPDRRGNAANQRYCRSIIEFG